MWSLERMTSIHVYWHGKISLIHGGANKTVYKVQV